MSSGDASNKTRHCRIWLWLRRLCLWCALGFSLWHWALPWMVPSPAALTVPLPESLILTDRYGTPLRRFLAEKSYRTEFIPLREMPADLIQCVIAAEDRRFFSHGGVDYPALGRAVKDAAEDGRFTSGASTITQQLVKITSPPAERNVLTKLREMFQARRIEMTWSKERIMEEYLNRVDCGNLCRGAGMAAEHYFGKSLGQLSLAECAWIAGLPQAPERHSRRDAAGSKRQRWVLERWAALHPDRAERAAAARVERLVFREHEYAEAAAHPALLQQGLKGTVRTAVDLPLQEKCQEILRAELLRLEGRNVQHGAVVVMENATCELLVLLGSANWSGPEGQINAALTPRSAGSTLKPFTYGLALECGFTAASVLEDVPSHFSGPGGAEIAVVNYDRRHRGPVPLREALACSLNVPAVRLLQRAGGPEALHGVLKRAGVSLEKESGHYGLGLTIGNAEVSLVELVAAYGALARMGEPCRWRLLPADAAVDQPGRGDPVFSKATCWQLADILSDPAARSAQFGTAGPLRLPFRCAVKTGTSSDFRDNWCVGYTPDYTVGVWVGNLDGSPMQEVSGASGAAPAFHRIMRELAERTAPRWYETPSGMVRVEIDVRTGKRPHDAAAAAWRRSEWFQETRLPGAAAPEVEGRALLPEEPWGVWYRSAENDRQSAFALASPEAGSAPRILVPRPGHTYQLDPELPGGGARMLLKSSLSTSDARWECASLVIESGVLTLVPGEHVLRVTDVRTGASAECRVFVKP